MWPWEHLAFGYVLYSLLSRATLGRAPRAFETGAVVLATLMPDLIDKTLSWGFDVFAQGYALGHSLVFAVPTSLGVAAYAYRRDRPAVGVAFVVGYASHLVGDVFSPLRSGSGLAFERLLWPFVTFPAYETNRGFLGRFWYYVSRFLREADDPENLVAVAVYLSVFVAVGALWIRDGAPGVRETLGLVRPDHD